MASSSSRSPRRSLNNPLLLLLLRRTRNDGPPRTNSPTTPSSSLAVPDDVDDAAVLPQTGERPTTSSPSVAAPTTPVAVAAPPAAPDEDEAAATTTTTMSPSSAPPAAAAATSASASAAVPKPEYPRPDFDRSRHAAWQCLNGAWRFAYDDGDVGIEQRWQRPDVAFGQQGGPFDKSIIVPFAHQVEASGLNDKTSHEIVWYARQVPVPATLSPERQRLLLNFEAVDYEAWVWASGSLVAHHLGGHTPFSADITDAALDAAAAAGAGGSAQVPVVVRVRDAPHDLTQPRGKQYWKAQPESIFYYPTTGIWQSVWTQVVPRHRLERAVLTPDIDAGTLRVEARATPGTVRRWHGEAQLRVEVLLGSRRIGSAHARVSDETAHAVATVGVRVPGSLPPAELGEALAASAEVGEVLTPELAGASWHNGLALWSPEHPTLYTVRLALLVSGEKDDKDGGGGGGGGGGGAPAAATMEVIDQVDSYAGMRKVSVQNGKFCLNNRPYFQALNLDQGYWPHSGFTAPSDQALKDDIIKMKEIGMNGARKHQKLEEARWLYHADRLGYLVWSEMANAYDFSADYVQRFTSEWTEAVRRDQSHPCIVVWTPINESWGVPALPHSKEQRDHLASLYYLTKTLDPTRLVVDNDGWEHVKTDLCTFHDYAEFGVLQNTCRSLDLVLHQKAGHEIYVGEGNRWTGEPVICSEMGGVAIAGGAQGWGYNTASSDEDLLNRIRGLVDAVVDGVPELQGFVWTQTADCLQEVNGLLTAERRHKLDVAKLRAVIGRRP